MSFRACCQPAVRLARGRARVRRLLVAIAGRPDRPGPRDQEGSHASPTTRSGAPPPASALSPDGKHLAYTFTPAEGDGAVVIRNVPKGSEHRIPSGGKRPPRRSRGAAAEPPAAFGGFAAASGPAVHPGLEAGAPPAHPDEGRPRQGEGRQDEGRRDCRKTVLAVIDLATGKVTDRFEQARSFSVGGDGAGFLIYRKEPSPRTSRRARSRPKEPRPAGEPGAGAFGGRGAGGTPGDGRPTPPRPTYGTDLVVRDLADGSETHHRRRGRVLG